MIFDHSITRPDAERSQTRAPRQKCVVAERKKDEKGKCSQEKLVLRGAMTRERTQRDCLCTIHFDQPMIRPHPRSTCQFF